VGEPVNWPCPDAFTIGAIERQHGAARQRPPSPRDEIGFRKERRLRVLVADADDRTVGYLARGLSESGHIVDRVDDAETALAMAAEGIYEVIVLDRKLPGADGLALLRRLRQRDGNTPVLMLGQTVSAADRAEGLRAGCDDYLGKPYSFS